MISKGRERGVIAWGAVCAKQFYDIYNEIYKYVDVHL